MATTQWYTPYPGRDPSIRTPTAGSSGYSPYSLSASGQGIYDLLGEQARLRNAIAREQLEQMRNRYRNEMEGYGGRRRADAELMAERIAGARQARRRAAAEDAARANVVGEAMRGSPYAPRDYRDYNRAATLRMYTGGPTGRTAHQGIPLAEMDAFNRARMDDVAARRNAPLNQINWELAPYRMPVQSGFRSQVNAGLPTQYEGRPGSVSTSPTIRPYEKGSLPGTIPSTGPAKLHKGEVVVSADQVDEPLLKYLIEDKMAKLRTGQMDGKGTGPGREMPEYQTGSYETLYSLPTGAPFPTAEDIILARRGEEPASESDASVADAINALAGQFGGSLRAGAGRLGQGLGFLGDIGGAFLEGAFPEEPRPMPEMDLPTPARQITPAIPEADLSEFGEEVYTGDVARARERIAGGDFGTPEDPLALRGQMRGPGEGRGDEYLPPEERYFAPEEPRWRAAQDRKNALAQNEMRLDNIQTHLMMNAASLPPETFKALQDQAKQISAAIQMEKERESEHKKTAAVLQSDLEKAYSQVRSALAKAEADATTENVKELGRQSRFMQGKLYDLQGMLFGNPDMPEEFQRELVRSIAGIEAQLSGMDPEELEERYYERLGL